MKRLSVWLSLLSLVAALSVPMSIAYGRTSATISLRIGDRYRGPDLAFYDEPDMYVIPGTRVYYIRDSDYDLYRFGGWYYYNYSGDWYRARSYRGPFTFVSYRSVPRTVYTVGPRYRRHWTTYRDVHYRWDRDGRHDRGRHRGWGNKY